MRCMCGALSETSSKLSALCTCDPKLEALKPWPSDSGETMFPTMCARARVPLLSSPTARVIGLLLAGQIMSVATRDWGWPMAGGWWCYGDGRRWSSWHAALDYELLFLQWTSLHNASPSRSSGLFSLDSLGSSTRGKWYPV